MPQTPFGLPIDPADVPPTKVPLLQTLGLGYARNVAAPNLPAGATPDAQNILAREQAVEPRFRLSQVGTNTVQDVVLALGEHVTTSGTRTPFVASKSTLQFYSGGSWGNVSYSSGSSNDPWSGADTNYMDWVVAYHASVDSNQLVLCNGVDHPVVWGGPSTTTYSTLTGTPLAKYCTVFDSRLVFGDCDGYTQRVAWSARGDIETYTEPTGGSEDLLDAHGAMMGLATEADRIIVFFNHEIWFGYRVDYPFDLTFTALDRTVGCCAPWSITKTPKGIIFLGDNYQPYCIPPGGIPQPIGLAVWKTLRDTVTTAERSTAAFNAETNEWALAYPVKGGTGRCDRGVNVEVETGAWTLQAYEYPISRFGGFGVASSDTQWNSLIGTWDAQQGSWGDLAAAPAGLGLGAGTSNGTVGLFGSAATGDFGKLVTTRFLAPIPNPDPSTSLFVREIRLDYAAESASSLTVKLSGDFGNSYPVEIGVALPAASPSAQTTIHTSFRAVYPSVAFVHDQGQRWNLQRAVALVQPLGRG